MQLDNKAIKQSADAERDLTMLLLVGLYVHLYRKSTDKRLLSYKRFLDIKRPWCGVMLKIDA